MDDNSNFFELNSFYLMHVIPWFRGELPLIGRDGDGVIDVTIYEHASDAQTRFF